MAALIHCPFCGRENNSSSNYCVFCGREIKAKEREKPVTTDNPPPVRRSSSAPSAVAPVVLDGSWHLIDTDGAVVCQLPYKYNASVKDDVGPFFGGFSRVRSGHMTGYIDMAGREAVHILYLGGSSHFSEGLVAVQSGDKWGYLNTYGAQAIPYVFDQARDFSENLAAVQLNDKWGFIDRAGRRVIPFIFDSAESFSDGLACVEYGGGYGYINKNGQAVGTFCHGRLSEIEGFLTMGKNALTGYRSLRNTRGEVVSRLPFQRAFPFSDNVAVVEVPEEVGNFWLHARRYRYIDKMGNYLKLSYGDNDFGVAGDFSEGLATVSRGHFVDRNALQLDKCGDLGYIDHTGKLVHPHRLKRAYPFRDGLAHVAFQDRGVDHVGFINKTGAVVLDYNANDYSLWKNFSMGLTPIGKRNGNEWKYGYINKNGDVVVPFRFDRTEDFGN